MPPSWLVIKRARPDLTDYVIHWTRGQDVNGERVSAFDNLKRIVASGMLVPSFAPKRSVTAGGVNNTIQGPYPAVCFTEQPLDAFLKSCGALGRYRPYAVAVRKDRLFVYGGRPVIYGDKNLLPGLPVDFKYLWVRFNPVPNPEFGGYPLDWTHEREWRARAKPYTYVNFGPSPESGVPLLLPPDFASSRSLVYLPWLIVKTKEEAEEMKEWIVKQPPYMGTNGVLKLYFEQLSNAFIISLDEVGSRLKEGDDRWARLDTLPYEEINPETTEKFKQIGWKTRR